MKATKGKTPRAKVVVAEMIQMTKEEQKREIFAGKEFIEPATTGKKFEFKVFIMKLDDRFM